MADNHSHVWQADWEADQHRICDIRYRVFIREQGVPATLEWDGLDATAIHLLGRFGKDPACATARLLPSGQIGRMAVLREQRGHGLGSRLLQALLAAATDAGLQRLYLHAQLPAQAFYQRHGFESHGEIFVEAGIRHRLMSRRL